jgi:hypothetical protein
LGAPTSSSTCAACARLAPAQAGGAALAQRRIALRHVVEHDLDAGIAHRGRDVGGFPVVRVLVFHRAEPGARGGGKALQKINLAEQHRNVGGKFRHRELA